MIDRLPEPILQQIRDHLREAGNDAADAWQSASADEDTLTGDVFGHLRRRRRRGMRVGNRIWRWSVDYRKLRGRGAKAAEKRTGADGIIEIEATDLVNQSSWRKGILFQAKKTGARSGRTLNNQIRRMERLAPTGSAYVEYGPDGCIAEPGHRRLAYDQDPGPRDKQAPRPLGDFLADRFLRCKEGVQGMYLDGARGILVIPDGKRTREIRLFVPHRLTVRVTSE